MRQLDHKAHCRQITVFLSRREPVAILRPFVELEAQAQHRSGSTASQGAELRYRQRDAAATQRSSVMTAPLVEFRGVSHAYGDRPVLAGLDLAVTAGESLAAAGAWGRRVSRDMLGGSGGAQPAGFCPAENAYGIEN